MRREFPKSVKVAAWNRSGGQCEGCTAKLFPGKYEYHHIKEDTFGGEPVLGNCVVLCIACHGKITASQAGKIAKSNAVRNKYIGIKRNKGRPMPGTKASGLKRRMDGTWEKR